MLPPDLQRLEHICDYCARIQKTVLRCGESFEIFKADADFQQSVAFCVLQIGELTNKLSPQYRQKTSTSIPWKLIRNMRNLVVHDYGRVNLELLWNTVITDIPELKQFCVEQLASEEQTNEL